MKTISLVFIFILISVSMYPYMVGNQLDCLIRKCDSTGIQSVEDKPVLVQAAGYFIKAKIAFLEYCYGIEMGEALFPQTSLDNAFNNIFFSNEYYKKLLFEFQNSKYNLELLEKLNSFNYEEYKKINACNSSVFDIAATLLKKGDCVGIVQKFIDDTKIILIGIQEIKSQVNAGVFNVKLLWRINQKFDELGLFGQYIAEIMESIM